MQKIFRWGIIGCGDVTEVKSGPAYQLTEGFELYAVMRRDEEKLIDYARRHQVPKYTTNAPELINDKDVDAVYIATPPDTHLKYALMVAEAGKPCCVEKPMAINYNECVRLVEAFENKSLPLFVAYYRRSLPRFKQVKSWLAEKCIGKIRHVTWHYSCGPKNADLTGEYNWRTDAKIAPGGYFDDLASHGIDLITFLLGNISIVKGISLNQQNLYTAKDAMVASWVHESGATGTGSWNFGSAIYEDRALIYGSEGSIEFSVFDNKPVVLNHCEGTLVKEIENPEHIQLYHVADMKDHLMGKKEHPSLGESAAHTSWVMDEILS